MTSAPASPLRFAFAGAIAMAVAMGIGRFVYTPILPGMMAQLGLSASDAGLIASANYIGYLVGAVLGGGGWASGRERSIMLLWLAASGILAAAMGLTENLWAFLAIRFLAGLASAFIMVFLATIVFSHLAAAGRSDLQALHFAGVGTGIAGSGVMIGILLTAGAGWEAGWFWAGGLSLAGFAVVALLIDRGPVATGQAVREPPMPKSAALRRFVWAYGIFGFGYIVTATFLVAIVRQGDAGRLFEAGVWIATGLAGIPSTFLWAWVARRIGVAATFAIGAVVEAVGVLASVSLGGVVGPLLGGVLLGGTFIAITALGLQVGRLLAGASPRRVLALMTAAFGTGQILGPILAGFVADVTGDFVLASVLAACAMLVCGLVAWSARGVATPAERASL